MAKSVQDTPTMDIRDFFSAAEARIDRWRTLNRVAKALAATGPRPGAGPGDDPKAILTELQPLEDLCGYPGPRLMTQVHERLQTGDWTGFARLVQRISGALLTSSYRDDHEPWKADEEGETHAPDILPPSIGRGQARRPYFEILLVSPAERAMWPEIRETFRRIRRPEDEFVYEPVVVGSFEDAVLAVVFNPNLQAVVISDGFGYPSPHTVPVLREILTRQVQVAESARQGDLGTLLARLVRRWRPELDVYLTTDRDVARLAGSDDAAPIRRIFYGVEEPMEIHLAILDGVKDRYETPYFDNLKHYAQRPIGTFHALPVARGKSIFKSNWIRDMGEFYGANLFLAESSATTGGLDSLLEPTGNIKVAQDKAARALGGDRAFFVTNGTSTSNKIVHQAILKPGDIVLIDRDCHKSHHYGLVLAGAQPLYIDAFPLTQFSMYGSLAIKPIKQALLRLKAEGKLDRAKLLVLTNCTFDGHVANVKRTMLECLAIKPDLVFLWDEAWFGFARFSPFLRRRTAMGAAAAIRELMRDPEYRKRYDAFKASAGKLDPKDPKLVDMELLPDPDKVRVRVYETDSVHKSMSSLRQGSIIVVADQDFHTVEPSFKEAFFTHTSTSPNLQIIASLDVARRQMELEGYELVGRAMQLALEARRQINAHPLISKYFRIATPAEMIPAEYRKSGFADWGAPGWTMSDTIGALDHDEFYLDPTRITLLCGAAGYDGTPVQGDPRQRARHPDQQDVAQQRARPDQHQQHAERPRAPDEGAGRHGAGDREAARRGRRGGSGGLQGAGEVAGRGRAGPAGLPALPRRLPRQPEERHPGRAHARGLLHGLRRRQHRARQAPQQGDRRAARQGPGARLGEVRDPVPARLPDHGAGPGRHEGDHHLHAQARREGDPRLQRRQGPRAPEARRAGQAPDEGPGTIGPNPCTEGHRDA